MKEVERKLQRECWACICNDINVVDIIRCRAVVMWEGYCGIFAIIASGFVISGSSPMATVAVVDSISGADVGIEAPLGSE